MKILVTLMSASTDDDLIQSGILCKLNRWNKTTKNGFGEKNISP